MIVVICFLVAARTILHSPPFVVEPGTGWNLGTLFAPVVRGFSFYPFHYFAARGLSGLINYYGDFFFHLLFSPLTLILVAMALVVAFRKPQRRAECNDPTVNHLKFCNSCECVFDPATGRYYPFDDADQFTKRYL